MLTPEPNRRNNSANEFGTASPSKIPVAMNRAVTVSNTKAVTSPDETSPEMHARFEAIKGYCLGGMSAPLIASALYEGIYGAVHGLGFYPRAAAAAIFLTGIGVAGFAWQCLRESKRILQGSN